MATFPIYTQPEEIGSEHTEGRVTWVWDGTKWDKQSPEVKTDGVALTDPTNPATGAYSIASPNKIPSFTNLQSQRDANAWMVDSLEVLDDCFDADGKIITGIPVSTTPPTEFEHGTLWFESDEESLTLFMYYDPVGDLSGGWIPAAPPSTLEGRVSSTEAALQQLEKDVDEVESDIVALQAEDVNLSQLISQAAIQNATNFAELAVDINNLEAAQAGMITSEGGNIHGILRIDAFSKENNDTTRFFVRDYEGNTNLTVFPTGVITGKNVIRVNRDSGDCFQVKDGDGNLVKWKVDFTGTTYSPKLILTGGSDVTKFDRVIDVQAGQPGRLLFNGNTSLTWQNASVKIGRDATVDSASAVKLDLQNNLIDNVSEFKMTHQGGAGKKFTITGEDADGNVSDDFFYSYNNAAGTPSAMNYNGKMDSDNNLVNKKYVDDLIGSPTGFVAKGGDTMTGTLEINGASSGNAVINLSKSGNNDVQYQGNWIMSFQGNDTPSVKLAAPLHMNSKQITNVANPTADSHAVNRGSLVGAKVVSPGGAGTAQSGGLYYTDGRLFYKI